MGKNKYLNQQNTSQQSQPAKPANPPEAKQPETPPQAQKAAVSPSVSLGQTRRVQPEGMSLSAHSHIQKYLQTAKKSDMEKKDLNAVLRLSQHLRVFGLVSAVGYLNQSNAQENNETRKCTVPVWGCLLGQMLGQEIDASNPQQRRQLMESVVQMARQHPAEYMATWRKSLLLAEQWNFWARAYAKGE